MNFNLLEFAGILFVTSTIVAYFAVYFWSAWRFFQVLVTVALLGTVWIVFGGIGGGFAVIALFLLVLLAAGVIGGIFGGTVAAFMKSRIDRNGS